MLKFLKKSLFQIHRLAGVLLSLMFVLWFASGIVLIFAGFPHASRHARFWAQEVFTAKDFQHLAALPDTLSHEVELLKLNGRPVYSFSTGKRARTIVDAQSLQPIDSFSIAECRAEVLRFAGAPIDTVLVSNKLDQWVPWEYYRPLLPFYKFYLNDAAHSVVYASARTGSIIQHTTRKTRWLARVGAIPHWLYFYRLRSQVLLWKQVVLWLAVIGLLVCLSGLVLGVIRMRQQRKKMRPLTRNPYRKFWWRQHYLFGWLFGVFLFTFLLSGLFTVVDFRFDGGKRPAFSPMKEWNRTEKSVLNAGVPLRMLAGLAEHNDSIRRLVWGSRLGRPVWQVYSSHETFPQLYAIAADSSLQMLPACSESEVRNYTAHCFPDLNFKLQIQTNYDDYYRASGMAFHPLPVFHLKFADADLPELYIDPGTGKAVFSLDQYGKIRRWLYRGLHAFDTAFLMRHQWLRISLLLVVSVGGLWLSWSGVVLSWQWLVRRRLFRKQ